MKVVFAYKGGAGGECIGIEYLSAVLKQHGHETSLIYESHIIQSEYIDLPSIRKRASRPEKVAARILREKPGLVAFSVVTDHYQWACAVAKELKRLSDTPTVFGGIHVTALPDRVIQKSFVDFAVVGEGEYALLNLVNALESDRDTTGIPSVWCKSNGKIIENPPLPPIENLNSLPFPDRSIFTEKVPIFKEIYYAMSSRGCPYSCTYCCNNLLNKMYGSRNFLRRRTPENVIEELRTAMEKDPFKMVQFIDDDFVSDRKWLEEFLSMYKKQIGVIFRCLGSARYVDDDVATMLAEAGCRRIEMGVQTWNEELKRKICHRYETNEQIIRACKAVRKAGMYLELDYIFGLPLHEKADYIEAVRQYSLIRPDNINCFWLRYYPGTEIIGIAQSYNLLSDQDIESIKEGTGRTVFRGGSVKNADSLTEIVALFRLIPFFKSRTILMLLERGWSKWLPKSFAIFAVGPPLMQMVFNKDQWYVFRRRVMEFPPFRK